MLDTIATPGTDQKRPYGLDDLAKRAVWDTTRRYRLEVRYHEPGQPTGYLEQSGLRNSRYLHGIEVTPEVVAALLATGLFKDRKVERFWRGRGYMSSTRAPYVGLAAILRALGVTDIAARRKARADRSRKQADIVARRRPLDELLKLIELTVPALQAAGVSHGSDTAGDTARKDIAAACSALETVRRDTLVTQLGLNLQLERVNKELA